MSKYDDDNKEPTGNLRDSEDHNYSQYDADQKDDSDTQFYEQESSVLEESPENHGNPKKNGKLKWILGGVGAAIVVAGGVAVLLGEEDPIDDVPVETQNKNNVVTPKGESQKETILIDENSAEKDPLMIDLTPAQPKEEPKQENIFKDIDKTATVEVPPLVEPVKPIEHQQVAPITPVEPTAPHVTPIVPIEPVVPVEPVKPVEPIAPVETIPSVGQETVVDETASITLPNVTEQAKETITIDQPSSSGLIDPDNNNITSGTSGLIEPNFDEKNIDVNGDMNETITALISEMSNVSTNIKNLNTNLKSIDEQVVVNKADIVKLQERVAALEKLHFDKNGALIPCASVCNGDGGKVLPVSINNGNADKGKTSTATKKVVRKPVNRIDVVSKKGDLENTKTTSNTNSNRNKANATRSSQGSAVKLESIVGNRAWVRSSNGSIKSYGIGDTLPNGKKIGNIETRNGVFDTNGHLILTR